MGEMGRAQNVENDEAVRAVVLEIERVCKWKMLAIINTGGSSVCVSGLR